MHSPNRRRVTIGLVSLAASAALIAALLGTSSERAAVASGGQAPEPVPVRLVPPPPAPSQPTASKPVEPPRVDVVFALDTTGSMSGLIEGAKRKIWSVATQLASGQPKPDVRIGLIGYRDLGDEYVTRRYALSEDMDEVYANLTQFSAGGGGDTPEHVNLALDDAMRRMQWREGQNVLRLVFLVGDAPPHEGRQGLYSSTIAAEATRRGIIINTIRCGAQPATEVAWRRIADAAGGMYTSVRQDGAMIAVATPVDSKLAELNAKLSSTLLPVGSAGARSAAWRRARVNAAMDTIAQADSAGFRSTSGKLDSTDVLSRVARGEKIEDLKDEELPAALAAKPMSARKAYIEGLAKERAKIQSEVRRLSDERQAYLKAKRPTETSVDDAVASALKKQGKKAGIAY